MSHLKTCETRLESAGFRLEQIPQLSDAQILSVRGIGPKGLAVIRLKYGPARVSGSSSLEDEIVQALTPVLMKYRGIGIGTVRKISRMVVVYIKT